MPVLNGIYNLSMALLRSVNLAKPQNEPEAQITNTSQGQSVPEQTTAQNGSQAQDSPFDPSTATMVPPVGQTHHRTELNDPAPSDPATGLVQKTPHRQNGFERQVPSPVAANTPPTDSQLLNRHPQCMKGFTPKVPKI